LGDDLVSAMQAIQDLGVESNTITPTEVSNDDKAAIRKGLTAAHDAIEEMYKEVSEKVHEVVESQTEKKKKSHHRLLASEMPSRPHSVDQKKKGCHGKKGKASMKLWAQEEKVQGTSAFDNAKQWGQELYQDLSSIDFSDAATKIAETPDALCAVGAGFFGGLILLTIVAFIAKAHHKRIQLAESDDEEVVNEKQ
jgi:hypothetical protein